MRYLRLAFILIFLPLIVACSKKNENTTSIDSTAVDTTQLKEPSTEAYDITAYTTTAQLDPSVIEVVDSISAILINPTPEQIDHMIKEFGEDDFYTLADDESFYMSNAMIQLDSFAIKIIEPTKQYIQLKDGDKSWLLDTHKEGAPEWSIIFFTRTRTPQVMAPIDVTPEEILSFYGLDR